MGRWGAAAILILASCSSSTTLSTYAAFVAANNDTFCQHQIDCGFFDASYKSICKADPPGVALFDRTPQQIGYDPVAGRACHEALAAAIAGAGCFGGGELPGIWSAALSDACTGAVHGRVALGGACLVDGECAGPAICQYSGMSCSGTCVARAAVGASCDTDSNCSADAYCGGVVVGTAPVCIARGGAGATCLVTDQCQQGLVCGRSPQPSSGNRCNPLGAAGAGSPCLFPSECASGLFCDGSLPDPTCSPRQTMGQRCSDSFACGERLLCIGWLSQNGTCAPPQPKGKPCQSDNDCQSPHQCRMFVCTPPPMLGDSCNGFDCAVGYCDASHTCRAGLVVGANCDPSAVESGCPVFTSCDPATSKCKSCR
jgi:hypothetical protein